MAIKGHVVRRLWIEKATDIAKEYYASFTLDRSAKLHLAMVSARGGVDIEQVVEEDPDTNRASARQSARRRHRRAMRELVDRAGLDLAAREGAAEILVKLYKCYIEGDADLVEINPLVLTTDGEVRVLDAKVTWTTTPPSVTRNGRRRRCATSIMSCTRRRAIPMPICCLP